MANYCAFSRTNYFRVTDEEKYKELFAGLTDDSGDGVEDFTKVDKNGVTLHGFGTYGSIEWHDPAKSDEDDDYEDEFDTFLDRLKEILPDDDAMIMTEVGYEKLRYLTAYSIVVTKNNPTQSFDLGNIAVSRAKDLLGNREWHTEMEY